MKKNLNLLIITVIITLIIFGLSIYLQRKIIDYEPTIKCLVATKTVDAFSKLTKDDVKVVEIPISLVATVKVVSDISEVSNLYLKDKIYNGQIIMQNQFDTEENLSIYKAEVGMEKVSIKIKSSENAVSYNIRKDSFVNLYATLRSEYVNEFFTDLDKQFIGAEYDGYCIVKILDNTKVLGVFDIDGYPVEGDGVVDTVMFAVEPENAKRINLIRDIATFNITVLGSGL